MSLYKNGTILSPDNEEDYSVSALGNIIIEYWLLTEIFKNYIIFGANRQYYLFITLKF